ncbi:MAG: efflux RND transporter periplasmic adaptor subunit [Candidatus Eisenbacteria bacterium]
MRPMNVPALVLFLAALALAGCGGKGEHSATKQAGAATAAADTALFAASDVATVTRADLSAGVPVSGNLAPGWRARVTSPLDEVVADVLVREGQRVARGQVLARFRMEAVEAAAASARAQLKSAQADFERQKNLLREGAVSERDLESAEAAYRAAAAAEAAASHRFSDASVRAPGAGTVTVRSVQAGDRVGFGDPLFVIADTRELEFEATVPSEFVRFVKPGAAVTLSVTGWDTGAISGRVARVNATADEATRQVKVYVTVPNADGRIVGDLYASGSIVTEHAPRVLAVPAAAARRKDGESFAWVVTNGVLAKKPVKFGMTDEAHGLVQVAEGLAEGETVVTGPSEGLADGQPVRVSGKER